MKRVIAALLLATGIGSANAEPVVLDWTILTDPSLFEGSPGPDRWWGTGDDAFFPGSNTNIHGGTWAYDVVFAPDSRTLFGFGQGSFSTALETSTGAFDFLSFDGHSDYYDTLTPLNVLMTASLAPGVNGGQINMATLELSYEFNVIFDTGIPVNAGGLGWLLPNVGASAAAVFGPGDVATSLDFAIALLPSNWEHVAVFRSDLFLPDPFNVPGTATFIAYTVSAVPIPAAVWLFSSGIVGLIGIGRTRKKAA